MSKLENSYGRYHDLVESYNVTVSEVWHPEEDQDKKAEAGYLNKQRRDKIEEEVERLY